MACPSRRATFAKVGAVLFFLCVSPGKLTCSLGKEGNLRYIVYVGVLRHCVAVGDIKLFYMSYRLLPAGRAAKQNGAFVRPSQLRKLDLLQL